ncbi:putative thiamine transport system substrate-binding protein [Aureimonas altamirensis DSM 21988]|nr:ABC transporter substrate-binding protein [Aureimonas altamirensis]SHJ95983.1 putative thiamine transport system substrate-binding protein [Aureimonas altamirensis DSM 21988]
MTRRKPAMSFRRAALAAFLTFAMAAPAAALPDLKDWPAIATAAQGGTVRLGVAGGSAGQQRFLDWAGGELERLYDIRLEIVDFPSQQTLLEALGAGEESRIDMAALGSRAVAEGRRTDLLPERYAYRLPNWHFVDRAGTPSVIFAAGLPTHYSAVPWGKRSVTLYGNGAATASRPDSPAALLTYARANPGRFAFPDPATAAGSAFLEEVLRNLAEDPSVLDRPIAGADAEATAAPFFAWLDDIRPLLWQEGRSFPRSEAEARDLLARGEVDMIADFNPMAGAAGRAGDDWPEGVEGFGFANGAVTDTHFLAVAPQATAPEAALVTADFMLSPAAQIRKADPAMWGDVTILDPARLPQQEAQDLRALMRAGLPRTSGVSIPRPHYSWMDWLGQRVPERLAAQ